jgi:Fungal specific transcription factor domain
VRSGSANDLDKLLFEGASYYLDDLDFSEFGDFGEFVDHTALPARSMADDLLEYYFATIHQLYPLVLKTVFMKQYLTFWQTSALPDKSITWLAMLNMMFAIGTMCMQAEQAQIGPRDNEHLVFFARARVLQPAPTKLLAIPTVEHVQILGLTATYLVASNQINRYVNSP